MGEARIVIPYTPRSQFKSFHSTASRFAVLACHRRAGKALDVATPILTADGVWKTMGTLADGDRVFDERGAPCTVVAAHPVQIGRPCFVVRFSDGAEVVADEDHLWHTQTKLDRAHHDRNIEGHRIHNPRAGSVKTTAQIAATIMYGQERNHSIRLAGPLQFPAQALPIDPYMLGVWLGDGTSRSFQVTTMDAEIVEDLRAYAVVCNLRFGMVYSKGSGRASTYAISGNGKTHSLTKVLKDEGLFCNKHIPEVYKLGSIDQRIALVRGLMDTDGSVDGRTTASRCEITQKSEALAVDIVALLRSLGVKASKKPKAVNGTTYWRIAFRSWFNPFKLVRKASTWLPPVRDAVFSGCRYIVAVEPVASRPVRCITVDSPSRLYLAGKELVPTHNTVAVVNRLIKSALTCPLARPRVGYVAPTYTQAKRIAWDYAKHYSAPIPGVTINESELRIDYPNEGRFQLYGAENVDSIRGQYFDDAGIDEYAFMAPTVWERVIRPALSDRKGRAVFISSVNGQNAFYRMYQDAADASDWYREIMRASETGIIDDEELAALRRDMPEDDYRQEYECDWLVATKGALFAEQVQGLEDQQPSRMTTIPYDLSLPIVTAWDLGVADPAAIWVAQVAGYEVRLIDYIEGSGAGLDFYIHELKERGYRNLEEAIWPHDGAVREFGSGGKSRQQLAADLGLRTRLLPNTLEGDQVQAARLLLPRCVFDRRKCAAGIDALKNARREVDEKRRILRPKMLHDWASHGAKSFMYLALGLKQPGKRQAKLTYPPLRNVA